jgi:hypothetical protein
MELDNQKQNIGRLITTKKYKLSFFGVSPKHDWNVAFNIGVILLIAASILYYLDSQNIKKSISEDSLTREDKKYFDIEKAKTLLNDFQKRSESSGSVDQSL